MGRSKNDDLNQQRRLGITFHRTFAMVRPAISRVLELAAESASKIDAAEALTKASIRENSHLGTIYVEAMPRYAYGSGLLGNGNRLTSFGEQTYKFDPLLDKTSTQWLMHYFLSAPQGPGPAFWHELVGTRFRVMDEFTGAELAEQIREFVKQTEGKALTERSARSTATVFLGTYTKSDALGRLGIIENIGGDRYRVLDPDPPPLSVFGIALLDYWNAHFGDRMTINLDALYGERSLGGLFMISPGRVNRYLSELEEDRIVEVYRISPPYTVVLLRQDSDALYQKLYAINDTD